MWRTACTTSPVPGSTLGANHGRALADAAQRFAEILRAAHEGHVEAGFVDVMDVIGGEA
jgi:hypothetical protein